LGTLYCVHACEPVLLVQNCSTDMLCLGIGSVCRYSYRDQRGNAVRSDRRLLLIAVRDGAEVKQRDEDYISYSNTLDNCISSAFLFCLSDLESDKAGRLIREAIWIRKTDNMNRDEGSYQLSHVWDKLLHTDDRHRKSVLMKAFDVKPKRRFLIVLQ